MNILVSVMYEGKSHSFGEFCRALIVARRRLDMKVVASPFNANWFAFAFARPWIAVAAIQY